MFFVEVKKVDVTSWKCHRLPWNCGEKVPPEQLVIKDHKCYIQPVVEEQEEEVEKAVLSGMVGASNPQNLSKLSSPVHGRSQPT